MVDLFRVNRRLPIDAKETALKAAEALYSKHGESLRILDMDGVSNLMDYCVIATGSSGPHLKALLGETLKSLKESGAQCFRKSGEPDSGWLLLDYVDVVVHIFTPAARAYYAIEELWTEAQEVPLPEM